MHFILPSNPVNVENLRILRHLISITLNHELPVNVIRIRAWKKRYTLIVSAIHLLVLLMLLLTKGSLLHPYIGISFYFSIWPSFIFKTLHIHIVGVSVDFILIITKIDIWLFNQLVFIVRSKGCCSLLVACIWLLLIRD